MTRSIEIAPDEYYHIYNRGTDRRTIFRNSKDRDRFLASLYLANSDKVVHVSNHEALSLSDLFRLERGEPLVDMCAYCLMPNHFHLIVRERTEGGTSKFMQKLLTGYTMYFNKINERTGALFQGTYQAQHVASDRYLTYLIAYIHLNPVKLIEPEWKESGIKDRAAAERYLDAYRYSSYADFCGEKRPEGVILDRSALPEYFTGPAGFRAHMTEWLTYR